jgi:hypothetical protein
VVVCGLPLQVCDESAAVTGEVGESQGEVEPEAGRGGRIQRQAGNLDPIGDPHQGGAVVGQVRQTRELGVGPFAAAVAVEHDSPVGHHGHPAVDDAAGR